MENQSKESILDGLTETLNLAKTEEDVHSFLKQNDVILKCLGYDWAWSKLPLGSDYVTDFVLARTFSEGLHILALELENPNYGHVFTKEGRPNRTLATAISQVADWFIWIESNKSLFLKTIRKNIQRDYPIDWSHMPKHRFYKLSQLKFSVLVGRRGTVESELTAELKLKYQGISPNISIMSYDRVLENFKRQSYLWLR